MIGPEVTEGRPSRECQVVRPGPFDLKIAHNAAISVHASPLVCFRSTLEVLDTQDISLLTKSSNRQGQLLT